MREREKEDCVCEADIVVMLGVVCERASNY